MSQTIDNRVVEMQFDNANFEKNVSTSMSTLDKLKQKLDMSESSKNFTDLGKAANNVDFSGLATAVQSIADRFSTMGIIGMTVLQNLTNSAINAAKTLASSTLGMITSGGYSRAANIEKAKFQLEGLKVAWEDIEADINYGVKDTAYGLDAAANVASQLVASGVQLGDDMAAALRGVSGVAAMTSSSYEEIGSIFTTVAGQGALMTMQLRQLESRGLNAAAIMSEQFNNILNGSMPEVGEDFTELVQQVTGGAETTEASIREMVHKGVIDFETFSKAMNLAFGDHAKDANKTLNGVLANIRAAFARIGAQYIEPIIKNEGPLVEMFEQIRLRVNELQKALAPHAEKWVEIITDNLNDIYAFFKDFDITPIVKFVDLISVIPEILENIIHYGQLAFDEIFPDGFGWDAAKAFENIRDSLRSIFAIWDGKQNLGFLDYEYDEKGFKVLDPSEIFDERGFKVLRASAVEGLNAMDKMQSVFKGFFAVLDLGKQAIEGLLIPVKTLGSYLGKIFTSVSGGAASFGDWLVKIDEAAKESDIFCTIGRTLSKIIDEIAGIITNTSGALKNFKEHISDILEKLKQTVDPAEQFDKILSNFKTRLEDIKNSMTPLRTIVSNVANVFSNFTSAVRDFLNNAAGSEAGEIMKTGLFAGLLYIAMQIPTKLSGLAKSLGSLRLGFTGIGAQLNNTINQLRDTLFEMEKKLNAEYLKELAIAIAVLTASIFVLSSIDAGKLLESTAAVETLLFSLVGALKMTSSIGVLGSKSTVAIFEIIAMAIAVDLLASAVKKLSKLNFVDMIKGLAGVEVLLLSVAKVAKSLKTYTGSTTQGAKSLISFAAAILILSFAVKQIGGMDFPSMIQGLAGVEVMLISLAVIADKLSSQEKKMMKGSLAVIAFAASVLILTQAVKQLGDLDIGTLVQGLIGMAGVASAIVGVSLIFNEIDTDGMLKGSVFMIAFAVALKGLVDVVEDLGAMPFDQLMIGLGGTMALIVMLAGFTAIIAEERMAKNFISLGAGLAAFAIGLNLLVPPLILLGSLPIDTLVEGLFALSVALGIMLVAAEFAGHVAVGLLSLGAALALMGVGLLAAGAGVAAFAVGLRILVELVESSASSIVEAIRLIGTELIGLIPAFINSVVDGILSVLAKLTEAMPVIMAFFETLFSSIIQLIGTLVPQILELVKEILLGVLGLLTELTPQIIEWVGNTIAQLIDMVGNAIRQVLDLIISIISEYIPKFVETVLQCITDCLEAIAESIPDIIQAGVDIVVALAEGIASAAQQLIDAGFQLIIDFINGLAESIRTNSANLLEAVQNLFHAVIEAILNLITEGIPDLLNTGLDFFGQIWEAIKEKGPEILQKVFELVTEIPGKILENLPAIFEAGIELIWGLIEGIWSMLGNILSEVWDFICELPEKIKEAWQDFKDAAGDLIDGLIEGIKDGIHNAIQAVKDFCGDIVDGVKDFFGINSPSRVMREIGQYFDEGFCVGVDNYANRAVKAARNMAEDTVDAVDDTLSNISKVVDGNLDFDPVIRPHLDLSDLSKGINNVNSMFNDAQDYRLGVGNQNGGINGTSYSFVQNNYSPKSLSREDIYRDTKSLFATQKGAVYA